MHSFLTLKAHILGYIRVKDVTLRGTLTCPPTATELPVFSSNTFGSRTSVVGSFPPSGVPFCFFPLLLKAISDQQSVNLISCCYTSLNKERWLWCCHQCEIWCCFIFELVQIYNHSSNWYYKNCHQRLLTFFEDEQPWMGVEATTIDSIYTQKLYMRPY